MPTYDYKCGNCNLVFQFRSTVAERDDSVTCPCWGVAERVFSPNPNVFIPARFGLSRTWHMSDTGSSADGMVGNGSQVHAPKRESFTETFDKNWKKAGGSL